MPRAQVASKEDLARIISERYGVTLVNSRKMIEKVIDGIFDCVTKHGGISFLGQFTLEVRERAARKGRNPQTGAEVEIPAHRILYVKAGKYIEDAINEK